MSTDYRKLVLKQHPRIQERDTPEARFWRKFGSPQQTPHAALISHIHFSTTAPHDFVVTCGKKVTLYDGTTASAQRSIGRFDVTAYSGVIRADGKLVAGGDAGGAVKVFNAASKALLRSYKEHKGDVRAVQWCSDNLRVGSAGDDRTVRLWDLPTASSLEVRHGHSDYVRALACSPSCHNTWASGSYDKALKLWDMRQKGELHSLLAAQVCSLDHGAPISSCLWLAGGGVVVSGGGNEVKLWDMVAGRLMHTFSNHQKAVTCLAVDGTNTRLMSGGLDRHIKVYSITALRLSHGLKYHAPVLSLGVSPDNSLLIAGTTDCTLTVRQREVNCHSFTTAATAATAAMHLTAAAAGQDSQPRSIRTGTHAYFQRGQSAQPNPKDTQAEVGKLESLKPYDKALRKFKYKESLDKALKTRNPVIVVTVLEALDQRQGLHIALRGRDEVTLEPILSFLLRYVTAPKYAPLLLEVTSVVLTQYGGVLGESVVVDELFAKLQKRVKGELKAQRKMLQLVGALDAIVATNG
ncbi:unnamed protein product [Chrysoparadoxa australica]